MIPSTGHLAPPLHPMRSGVMDIQASPIGLDLANSPANAIRTIRQNGYSPGEATSWINSCLTNGLWPIMCFHTNYANTAVGRNDFVNDMYDALDGVTTGRSPRGFVCELGNEPGDGGPANTAQDKQDNRDNYLKMIFTPATSGPAVGLDACDVAHKFGAYTSMAAITDKTGFYVPLMTDVENGNFGADGKKFDMVSFHPYAQEPNDVENTLLTHRGEMDGRTSTVFHDKPMIVTEVGWSCAVRADGTNPTTFGGPPATKDDWNNVAPSWLGTTRSITRGEQADKIQNTGGTQGGLVGLWTRLMSRPELRLLAVCWFGHQDYGLPDGNGYQHAGLLDWLGNQRTAWARLNAQARFLNPNGHFYVG